MIQLKKILAFTRENDNRKILDCLCEISNGDHNLVLFDFDESQKIWNIDEFDGLGENLLDLKFFDGSWENTDFQNAVEKGIGFKNPELWMGYLPLLNDGKNWIKQFHNCYRTRNIISKEVHSATHFLEFAFEKANEFLKLKEEQNCSILKTLFKYFGFDDKFDLIPKEKMLQKDFENMIDFNSFIEDKKEIRKKDEIEKASCI